MEEPGNEGKNDGGDDGRGKGSNFKAGDELGSQPKQGDVDQKRRDAESDDGNRQSDKLEYGPNKGVDDADDNGGDNRGRNIRQNKSRN